MSNELLQIEKCEKELLFSIQELFIDSLEDFYKEFESVIEYLDTLVLPTLMGSLEKKGKLFKVKAYNPFSEIIEKLAGQIIIRKLVYELEEYKICPMGYSSDITLENEDSVLNIEIKTANLNNTSDIGNTVPLGINQFSHVTKFDKNLNFPVSIYPNLPPFYEKQTDKYVYTFAISFIYPSYASLINDFEKKYNELYQVLLQKLYSPFIVKMIAKESFSNNKIKTKEYFEKESKNIINNLIRGLFVHKLHKDTIIDYLNLTSDEKKVLSDFSYQLELFKQDLLDNKLTPISISVTSIPNGLLCPKYYDNNDLRFVSGKKLRESCRFYFGKGYFEFIHENEGEKFPRVLFVDIDEERINDLKTIIPEEILDYYENGFFAQNTLISD